VTATHSTLERRYLSKIRQILDQRFDAEELRTLCFDLDVDYEDLPARGQAHKARELVAYLDRHRRVPELMEVGRLLRPDIPWDEIFPQPISGLDGGESAEELTPPPEPSRPPQVGEFVGREAELAAYAERLARCQPAVIAGMAGVGKTALAVSLARRVADAEHTFWHTFHEGEGVQALLWKLAAFLAWRGQADLWQMLQGAQQSGGQPPPTEVLLDYLFQSLRGQAYTLCLDDWHLVEEDPLLEQLVERLNTECSPRGVRVTLKTIALGPERIAESNQIRIDGRLLEQLQPQIVIGQNDCPSCGELLGHPQDCPTVEVDGQSHDVPPVWLIRQGVCRSAGCC
jgi:hypothetical protein